MPKRKKYQAKHDWVRKYVPKDMWQIADSAVDHIGKVLDKTGPRDVVYVVAYMAAVYQAYYLIKGGIAVAKQLPFIIFSYGLAGLLYGIFRTAETVVPEEFADAELDMKALTLALIAGYMVLKTDVADIASAVTKIPSLLTGLTGASPVAP